MWKYKNQTLTSVVGLAVGFTCFVLATLWIRYEMTFDNFHKNAEHMYIIYRPDSRHPTGYSKMTHPLLGEHLRETFPEIANAATFTYAKHSFFVEDVAVPAVVIGGDSSLLKMFDLRVVEGSMEFMVRFSDQLAITQRKAHKLFGDESPIGKTVTNIWGSRLTISAIVTEMPGRSNFEFDFIGRFGGLHYTIIELHSGINLEAFQQRLYEHETGGALGNISHMTITPLTRIRVLDPDIDRDVAFRHIVIFAISGLLVIVCSLFNYLTLFMSRFRIRRKELALRKVCGASGGSLLAMLSVEFLLTLLFAVVLGGVLIQLLHSPFLMLSGIQMELPAIYRELLLYIGGVIAISMLIFWGVLLVFRKSALNTSIRRSNNKLFRKASVIVQLVISIGFAFCTIVIMKQMNFLHHSGELGFSFHNRGSMIIIDGSCTEGLANQLRQIPEIVEVVEMHATSPFHLIPESFIRSMQVSSWDGKLIDAEDIEILNSRLTPEIIDFYEFQLRAGEMLTNADPENMVLINESAVRLFGWYDPVGRRFNNFTVKGVIRNVHNNAPTVPVRPIFYSRYIPPSDSPSTDSGLIFQIIPQRSIMFKYHEGMWESTRDRIRQLVETEHPNIARQLELFNTEEEVNKLLKSENALIRLLLFVSIICILICIFGFVSLVSLTCEERRKEIAIRKAHGAVVGDILTMFSKEYFLLLIIGATIAFTTSFLIMQRWLEHYVIRTSIPAWIYLSIVLALALVIVLCVGWQVYKSSVENPADVVKNQ